MSTNADQSAVALLSLALRDHGFIDRLNEDKVRFTGPARRIFDELQRAQESGRGIDEIILRKSLASSPDALALLDQAGDLDIPPQNYETHRDELRDERIKMEVYSVVGRYGPLNDPFEAATTKQVVERLVADASDLQERLVDGSGDDNVLDGPGMVKAMFDEMKARSSEGFPTGIAEFDEALYGGFRPGQMVVLAAYTGVGKSAMMCAMANHMIRRGIPVLMVSIEMTAGELLPRMIAQATRIPAFTFIKDAFYEGFMAEATPEELKQQLEEEILGFSEAKFPIRCDQTADVALPTLKAVIRRQVRLYGIKVVYVDYLQLMRTERLDNRVQELDDLCRGLKVMAKELGIVVVALAQLNRGSLNRDGKPRLADIRESGGIEQNANVVVLMSARDDDEKKGVPILFDIAKNRSGKTKEVLLRFHPATQHYTEDFA